MGKYVETYFVENTGSGDPYLYILVNSPPLQTLVFILSSVLYFTLIESSSK